MVKKISLIALLLVLFHGMRAADYYVDYVNGSDQNSGVQSSPFRTLYGACSKVTASGNTIRLVAGNHFESRACDLARGVNLTGAGMDQTFVYMTYGEGMTVGRYDAALRLVSSGPTANGGQVISQITFRGTSGPTGTTLRAERGIVVRYRENVEIHHCRVEDFEYSAIAFYANAEFATPPTHYQRGNSVHDCQLHNSSTNVDVTNHDHMSNCLRVSGQSGFLCYNNNMSNEEREASVCHDIMGGGWNKHLKIYNNTFTKRDDQGSSWNFFFELFHWIGGGELHHNTFIGNACCDIVEVRRDTSAYGLKVYANTFNTRNGTKISYPSQNGNPSIDIENRGMVEDLEIYDNEFRNVVNPIWLSMMMYTEEGTTRITSRNIKIHHNRMINPGSSSGGGWGIWFHNNVGGHGYSSTTMNVNTSNIQIYNNTIYAPVGLWEGIQYSALGPASDIYIRNNIITGCDNAIHVTCDVPSSASSTYRTINGLYIQNNLKYNNGNSNANVIEGSPLVINSLSQTGNLIDNPDFVQPSSPYDISLQSVSPAINAGYDSYLYTDPDGSRSDIGAIYYNNGTTPSDVTRPVISSFVIPSTSTSLTISGIVLTATDNVGITAWMVRESSSTPSVGSLSWQDTPPTTFSFSTQGPHTLYAWVKDAAGNISLGATDQVTITLSQEVEPDQMKPGVHNGKTLKHNAKLLTL